MYVGTCVIGIYIFPTIHEKINNNNNNTWMILFMCSIIIYTYVIP